MSVVDQYSFDDPEAATNVASCPDVRLRIGVFFDGTWNNMNNAEVGMAARAVGLPSAGGSYNTSVTHPAHLSRVYYEYAGSDLRDVDGKPLKTASVYVRGVATSDNNPDSAISGATAFWAETVEERLVDATLSVLDTIDRLSPTCPPEEVVLDLFGFSRGAATARVFANRVKEGVITNAPNIKISFMGLFDTVAAFGIAWQEWDDNFYSLATHIGPQTADKVVHLVAAHEIRENFSLSSIDPTGGGDREQILLPGVHGTIGGSPLDQPETISVAQHEISLMQAQGILSGDIDTRSMFTQRRYESDLIDGDRRNPGTYQVDQVDRVIWPGLRILSLEVMHAKAVAADVPFVGLDPAMALPDIFEPLKAAALAGQDVTPEMMGRATSYIIPSSRYWNIANHPDAGLARTIIPNRPGLASG